MKKFILLRTVAHLALAVLLSAAVSACSKQQSDAPPGDGKAPEDTSAVQTDMVRKAPDGLFYRNPLLKNIADPSVLKAKDGKYYTYPTGGNKFKVYSSTDLVHWKDEGVALQGKEAPWASNNFWAPDVKEHDGKYYMFFSAAPKDDYARISVAVSDKPTGPFHTLSDKPLFDFGSGTIDPFLLFDDDGKAYLYFSKNLRPVGDHKESQINVVELNADLQSWKGEPKQLTHPEQAWEDKGNLRWNEGSWVIKHNGTYYLMYSANCYCGKKYSVGYATSKSPLGPFVKYADNPVLSADYPQVSGTGHHAVVASPDGKELFIVYHDHIDVKKGGGARQLNIDRMGFREDGSIYVDGPTLTEQPTPSGTSEWRNIAGDAKLTASSTGATTPLKALTDGEFGVYKRTSDHEWESGSIPAKASDVWVQLEWDQPREINSVWIYDSGDPARALSGGSLILDDGTEIKGITFPKEPGAAAIVNLQGKKVKSLKFVPDEPSAGNKPIALSEITVLGK